MRSKFLAWGHDTYTQRCVSWQVFYYCMLLCSLNWLVNVLFFTLDSPPSISSVDKTPANFKQGGTLELHCQATATGSSLITYEWFATDFEGNSKDMLLSRYALQSNTGKLTISNLNHTQDDGYFYCVAANAAGKVRSKRLVIQVACEWHTISNFICACIQSCEVCYLFYNL